MSNEDLEKKLSRSYDEFSRLSTVFSKETKLREERDLRLAKQLKEAFEQVAVGKANASVAPEMAKGHLIRATQIIRGIVNELEGVEEK